MEKQLQILMDDLSNNLKNYVSLLPDISWPDIYNCLINMPSAYTHENLKAYKSLENKIISNLL